MRERRHRGGESCTCSEAALNVGDLHFSDDLVVETPCGCPASAARHLRNRVAWPCASSRHGQSNEAQSGGCYRSMARRRRQSFDERNLDPLVNSSVRAFFSHRFRIIVQILAQRDASAGRTMKIIVSRTREEKSSAARRLEKNARSLEFDFTRKRQMFKADRGAARV